MPRDSADGGQFAVFNIRGANARDPRNYFQISWASLNPTRVRYLRLGATDEWTLQTVGTPHVFHIHVNPFQVERRGPGGGAQWVWKDTQLIQADQTVKVYSWYTGYTGQYVLHCPILDHEDLGMMEVVEIVGTDAVIPGHAPIPPRTAPTAADTRSESCLRRRWEPAMRGCGRSWTRRRPGARRTTAWASPSGGCRSHGCWR